MRRLFALSALLAATSLVAAAGEWQGYIIDSTCVVRLRDKVAGHRTKCAIACFKSGYGLLTSEGNFVKFDETGNAKALEALRGTSKDQDLTAKVTGTLQGEVIKVDSITIQ